MYGKINQQFDYLRKFYHFMQWYTSLQVVIECFNSIRPA